MEHLETKEIPLLLDSLVARGWCLVPVEGIELGRDPVEICFKIVGCHLVIVINNVTTNRVWQRVLGSNEPRHLLKATFHSKDCLVSHLLAEEAHSIVEQDLMARINAGLHSVLVHQSPCRL